MRKFIIIFITLLLLSGCTSNSSPKKNTSENGKEQETIAVNKTNEAWNYVDKAFEKLKKVAFSYKGIESEFAHIMEIKGKLEATFGECSFSADVTEYGKEMTIKKGVTDANFVKDNSIDLFMQDKKVEVSLESIKKDYTDSHTVYTIHDGKIMSDDGKVNENLEEFVERTDNKMVYKIDAFKRTGSWGDFMMRGNVAIRLFPNQYFSGEIKQKGDGTEIIFSFTPDSEQYETFLKSDDYQMMYDAYCPINTYDEKGKLAFKDELKEAKIIYKFDKEGYPISYERYSNMYIEKFDQTFPYVVYYTFERTEK